MLKLLSDMESISKTVLDSFEKCSSSIQALSETVQRADILNSVVRGDFNRLSNQQFIENVIQICYVHTNYMYI